MNDRYLPNLGVRYIRYGDGSAAAAAVNVTRQYRYLAYNHSVTKKICIALCLNGGQSASLWL